MNKKIALSMFLMLFLFFSIGSIQASDVNATDLNAFNVSDLLSVPLDDETQMGNLETSNQNVLLADMDETSLSENIKNQTEVTSPKTNSYGYYSVILKDSATNAPLSNKSVNFIINNVHYIFTTDDAGVAGVNLDLNPGKYDVYAYFEGDEFYQSGNFTGNIQILPTIKASDITKYYKGSAKYTATFFDTYGKVLANKVVTITVNGKKYSKKTDSKGVVSLDVNLKPGTYEVVSANPVTGYKSTNSFKILTTITAYDLKKVKGDSNKFVAKFLKNNGKALSNQYVKVKINGKVYKFKTNSNGKIFLPMKKYKKGTYKMVCYNKDGLTKTRTVTIYNIANIKLSTSFYTFTPDDSKEISVKLTTTLGGSSVSGKTIRFIIDGSVYSRKTDSSGIARLKMNSFAPGLYDVEYEFLGNKFFRYGYSTNYVTILDSTDAQFTVKSTTKFGYGANTPLKVSLTAGNVPLMKRTVTFTIDGKDYSTTTDQNGIASVPIDLSIGNHTVSYKSYDQYKVNGISDSCNITVFERNDCKITWKSGTSFKDSSQSIKVLLTDSQGKPISRGTVKLTLGSDTFTAKTGSDGYATFKAGVDFGKYDAKVNFVGSNNFKPTSISKTINVELTKFGKGLNLKTSSSYSSAYLKSTRYCHVNSAKIKSMVTSLTKGLTNQIDKAKSLFNYVRDYISYSYYYNSYYGSNGALSSKSANCVDQAHLLIALYRTAGLKARYVHGSCRFSDGVYGHVWTQVLIGNKWVVGDPIGYANSLGKINNWNTNTYRLHNYYVSLPF